MPSTAHSDPASVSPEAPSDDSTTCRFGVEDCDNSCHGPHGPAAAWPIGNTDANQVSNAEGRDEDVERAIAFLGRFEADAGRWETRRSPTVEELQALRTVLAELARLRGSVSRPDETSVERAMWSAVVAGYLRAMQTTVQTSVEGYERVRARAEAYANEYVKARSTPPETPA